jgi:hypothetical protein
MSSPWTDAAEYGRGLGERLVEAMIQMPAIRAKMAQSLAEHRQAINQQLWERQQKEKEFGLRQEEVKAMEGNRKATIENTAAYRKTQQSMEQQRIDEIKNRDAETKRRDDNKQAGLEETDYQKERAYMSGRMQANIRNKQETDKQAEVVRHNKAVEAKSSASASAKTKAPSKAAVQLHLESIGNSVFQMTKDPGKARSAIKAARDQYNQENNGNPVMYDPAAWSPMR